jgi:FixJ family two-component response regulator
MPATTAPICILDDDFSVLSSLRELLASDGLEAETFNKPDEFLSYTQEHVVKLAVLDVWMPATNGMEVQVRLRDLSPGTRVIMITGREEAGLRAVTLKRGAIAFLVKPFDDEEFLALVHNALPDLPAYQAESDPTQNEI